ncbi:MAG: hypothetical protein R2797_07415 [Gelidibacter sp.]
MTIFLVIMSSNAFAQYPSQPTPSHIQKEADRLTDSYGKQLALTGVQIPLFKNVVEEYLMKAEKTKDALDGREELDALVELQARETLEMNDILTRPQYELYKKLKYKLQPLKVLKEKR